MNSLKGGVSLKKIYSKIISLFVLFTLLLGSGGPAVSHVIAEYNGIETEELELEAEQEPEAEQEQEQEPAPEAKEPVVEEKAEIGVKNTQTANFEIMQTSNHHYTPDPDFEVINLTGAISTNGYTKAVWLWMQDGYLYMAVSSTHGINYLSVNDVATEGWIDGQFNEEFMEGAHHSIVVHGIHDTISIDGEGGPFQPQDYISGNTKDSRWSIARFYDPYVTLNLKETGNRITSSSLYGEGHDLAGQVFGVEIPYVVSATLNKIWNKGPGSEVEVTLSHSNNGVILVDRNNTYEKTEFYKDSLFGIAGGFHLVGLDTVDRKTHINGNILANNFINGGDFGTSDLKEVSYLRNISGGGTINAGSHKDSILVVGKNTTIGLEDNGNAWSINGNKVDQPNKKNSPDSLWQDGSVEFIDFDKVKQQAKNATDDLAKLKDNATEIKNDDWNKQEIIVTEDSDYNVYNLQDGDFIFPNPIHIKGFNKDKASTLIINVDMSKMENKELFSIPNSVASYTDGSKVSTGEVSEWSNANVVWNIFDSSKSDNIYTGTVKNTGAVTGSILAIGATINLEHNLNGTVIGNKIVVTGETHRDDYVPPSKPEYEEIKNISIDVKKKVTGNMGDMDGNFSFTVEVEGEEELREFILSHDGDPYRLENIPRNAQLTLTETDSKGHEVTVKINNTEISVTDGKYIIDLAELTGENITIEVTNHKNILIDTGVTLDSLLYILILLGAVFGLAIKVIPKKNYE